MSTIARAMNTVSRLAMLVSRSALTAWIGAATLFVVVGVAEVTSPDFSSEMKDRLAVLRFPLYYSAGFALVSVTWCSSTLCPWPAGFGLVRRWLVSCLLTVVLIAMVVDYQTIYLPLEAMITPPGQVRTQEFQVLHERSTLINAVNLLLCLLAACLLNWPRRHVGDSTSSGSSAV